MPVLDVEIVGALAPGVRDGLARRIAERAGEALRAPPRETWVKLRFLDADAYAENGGGPPAGVQPVFVRALLGATPEGDALAERALALAEAVAQACRRPRAHVHVVFEPAGLGRVAFGGELVRARR